ncbi:MAG: hypothetical protein Q7S66_04890 [bacterium]|nr:hypothetical protein [bacterium]
MKSTQIERVLNLVRRTGDRLVIMDNQSDEIFTIMRLGDYEDLLNTDSWNGERIEDLSEREMMEKVDRDISYWRSLHEEEPDEEFFPTPKPSVAPTIDFMEDEDVLDEPLLYEEIRESRPASPFSAEEESAPQDFGAETSEFSENSKEESLSDVPNEDEDRFLLEPV